MANRIQLRRDTAANWTRVNPVLEDGEPGLEIDTNRVKYGDGNTVWTALAYATTSGSTLVNGANTVSLESTGALTLPNGSTIGDADTFSGVPITTDRGTILLGNSPEIGLADHFHIMKGGQQALDLFLGDDSNYVKLPWGGGVEIASQGNSTQYSWTFGTDGTLTLPTDGNINFANGVNILSTVGAGTYSNATVASYLLEFDGDIEFTSSTARIGNVDVITVTDSIRSPAYQFSNGVSILSNLAASTGDITFSGSDITGLGTNVTITADTTDYVFYSNGTTTFPATGNITAGNLTITGNLDQPNRGFGNGPGTNLYITAGHTQGCSIPGGDTIISGGLGYNGIAHNGGNVTLRTGDDYSNQWNFDYAGSLTFPSNLIIGSNPLGSGTIISQANAEITVATTGNAATYIGWSEFEFEPGNIALVAFNDTTGAVAIQTGATTGPEAFIEWIFDADGTLTFPTGGNLIFDSSATSVIDGVTSITANGNVTATQYNFANGVNIFDTITGVTSISTSVTTETYSDATGDFSYGLLGYSYAVNGVTNSFEIQYSAPLVYGNVDINVGNVTTTGTANVANLIVSGPAPSTLSGSAGDRAGMVRVDSNYVYYCTNTFASNVYTVGFGGAITNTLFITQGAYPTPQVGWIVSQGGYDFTIDTISDDGYGSWQITWVGTPYGSPTGGNATLTNPTQPAIWKSVPLSAFQTAANATTRLTNGGSEVALQANGVTTFGNTATISNNGEFRLWADNDITVYRNGQDGYGVKAGSVEIFTNNGQRTVITSAGLEIKTGNLIIPNDKAVVFANGVNILSTVAGGGGSYANADVAAYLAANTAIYLGNPVTRPALQANVTQTFIGNTTTIGAGSNQLGGTYILNNAYFGANGAMYARNTQTGAAQFSISGGSFSWAGTTGAVTAGSVQGFGLWASLNGSTFATQNSISIASAGTMTIAGAGGLITSQSVGALFNTTATTINLGGAATTINMGASTVAVSVGSGTGSITTGNVNTTNIYTSNAVIAGGYISGTANIAITSAGNISGVGNIIGATSNTTITAGAYVTSFLSNGVMTTGNIIQTASYYETYSNVSNTGGNITFNFANSSVFYAALTANVTANIVGIANSLSTVTGFTVIIDQGATPYRIANLQINGGSVQTIRWAGTTVPTGTASNTDIVSISLINLGNGTYRVLGQQSSYG